MAPGTHKQVGPRILALFQKRIDGDDSLLDLAALRFRDEGLGMELYAGSAPEVERLLRYRPSPETPVVVHLPRSTDLLGKSSRDLVLEIARIFSDRIYGLVVHDRLDIADRFEEYLVLLREINKGLGRPNCSTRLFIEYAAGLDPGVFVNIFRGIRELERISACIDIGHIGLSSVSRSFGLSRPGRDIRSIRADDPELEGVMKDIIEAVNSGIMTVLYVTGEICSLGKPVHFHLHDAHPLSRSSPFGVSDHLSFMDKIAIPFEFGGKVYLDPMFGPSGLAKVVDKATGLLGAEQLSFTFEIHPGAGRRPLGRYSYLFNQWTDKSNAERMNSWLSVLSANRQLVFHTHAKETLEMKQNNKMIIYNLFPLLAGRFSFWEGHFTRAAGMGFNWIFVNPVQKTGSSGSLYSISDYFDFNPKFISDEGGKSPAEQVKEMTGKAEELGLGLIIDLVINHCSTSSELIKSHPEWFVWESGRVAHPFANEDGKKVVWKDLAKFDHRNTRDKEGLFQFFLSVVKFLAGLGFKGFRCDAAYQVPRSLWERLISESRKIYPDLVFFAETLGCPPDQTRNTAGAGFDYIFNSSKWWDFRSPWLMEQYALTRDIAPSISFPESHDTLRLCDELRGNVAGLKQRYLFSALFSAGVMMPIGFEFGFRKRLHVVNTRPEDWEDTGIDLTAFISAVNSIRDRHPLFREEAPTEMLHYENPNILLMWKASVRTGEECLCIINKDIYNSQHFYAGSLQDFLQAGAPLIDISPEYALDYLPSPFTYDLRPGQGIVLITKREEWREE